MPKSIAQSLLVFLLILSPVFADTLSTFEQEGLTQYPLPDTEGDYYATLSPIESKVTCYAGVNLLAGLASYKIENKLTTVGGNSLSKSTTDNTSNFAGGGYFGLGTNIQHLYIGTELSLGTNFIKKSTKDIVAGYNVSLSVKQLVIAGLDFIPGYLNQSRDILLYGRLGIGASQYQLEFTDIDNKIDSNTKEMAFGLRAGFGIEYFMSDTISMRAEYLYSQYNNSSGSCGSISDSKYYYSVNSPNANQLSLGLTIHF